MATHQMAAGNIRRTERRPIEIPISLVLAPKKFKEDSSAITTNISEHGVGVRTKLSLAPGEWVGYIDKRKFPYAIPTRVVWAKEDEYTHWIFAGLKF
ncbi:MAG: PilZ domain-containing protein [Terriglobia bacterium]